MCRLLTHQPSLRVSRLGLLALLCWAACVRPAPCQGPNHPHYPPGLAPPAPPLPPLLYVRVSGPAGLRVTFYRGAAAGQTFAAPFTIGLRPGYVYRVQVSGIPEYPGLKLYPTLEVRGSVRMPAGMRGLDHPAALPFNPEDFTAVASGALLTRVITLERPDVAVPVATRPDQPLEFNAPPGSDPVHEALRHGRPLLVFRMGQRQLAPEELASQGIPGTVLAPGETALPAPRLPPFIPWTCAPVADPTLGPYHASEEICFHDGGDVGLPAGYDRNGQLRGLDPSDTIAEYADSKGQRRIACSNRICLCVPRYVVTRGETALADHLTLLGPRDTAATQTQLSVSARVTAWQEWQRERPDLLAGRQRPSANLVTLGAAAVGRVEGLTVVSTLRETASVTGTCVPAPAEPLDRPLKLIKWPDKCDAQVGDVVTIFLKYTNQGGRPITDIAVSDSLTARLEYVAGSARSDRDAVFTTQPNEAGSLVLRWEVNGTLPPGESGVVSFQVRVR
jgi:uncharacterized repeat protein (TIGR01451 family)